MGEMEKPFTCPQQDCRMSFTNEDHLQVHQRCHEQFSLHQGGLQLTSSLLKHGYLVDQTPTPSRFLKHSEEISLFQELNPFDLEFHKASLNRSYRNQLSVPENPNLGGSLETPRILPPVDSDETISSTSRDDTQLPGSSSSSVHCAVSTIHSTTVSNNNSLSTVPSSPQLNTPNVIEGGLELEKGDGRKKLSLNVSSASEIAQTTNIISTPTPVITAGPSVSQSLNAPSCSTPTLNTPNILPVPQITLNGVGFGLADLNTPGLSPTLRLAVSPPPLDPPIERPTDPVYENIRSSRIVRTIPTSSATLTPPTPTIHVPTSPLSSQGDASCSSVPPSPSATVLQLLLRLPNGQSIPVEIPATPVVTSSLNTRTTAASVVTCIAPVAPAYQTTAFTSVITNPTPSLAKLKLKQALASSNTAARPGNAKHSRATTADRIAEMTRNRNLSGGIAPPPGPSTEVRSRSLSHHTDEFRLQGDPHEGENSNSSCSSGVSSNSATAPEGEPKGGAKRKKNSGGGGTNHPEETPEEKRRKFLERNRVAAVRCREKKKRFVESIVVRSDELGVQNQKLQTEVVSLRAEVAALKSLLLKHKDCPVTLAMQGLDVSNLDTKLEAEVPLAAGGGVGCQVLPSVAFVPIKASTTPPETTTATVTVGQPTLSLPQLSSDHDLASKARKRRSLSLSSIRPPPVATTAAATPSRLFIASDPMGKSAYICSLPQSSSTSNSQIYIPSFDLSRQPTADPPLPTPVAARLTTQQPTIAPALGSVAILPTFAQPESTTVGDNSGSSASLLVHAPPVPPPGKTAQQHHHHQAVRGNAIIIQEPKLISPKSKQSFSVALPTHTTTNQSSTSSVIIDNAFCFHSKIVINQRPLNGVSLKATPPQR